MSGQGIFYESGGEALLAHLHTLTLQAGTCADVREELRKLIGYFENNRHRTLGWRKIQWSPAIRPLRGRRGDQ